MIDELQRDLEDDVGQVVQPTMEDAEEVTPRFGRQDIPVGATVSSRSRSVESLDQSWIRTRECGVEKDRLTNKGFGFWGSSSGMLTLSRRSSGPPRRSTMFCTNVSFRCKTCRVRGCSSPFEAGVRDDLIQSRRNLRIKHLKIGELVL